MSSSTSNIARSSSFGSWPSPHFGAREPLWLRCVIKVRVDGRAVDAEPTGSLAFGNALLYGLYYLGAQIYGIGFHLSMMLGDATSVQAAVLVACRFFRSTNLPIES